MANSICVLTHWEVHELEKSGIEPICSNHRHIKRLDAMEMTSRGKFGSGGARWVGKNRIQILPSTWTVRQSGYAGPLVLQVET